MLLGPRCLLEESNVSMMPRVVVPEGQSRFMNNASDFFSALPTIDLRLSESRNAICAALLVDDPMVVGKTNKDDMDLR